MTRGGLRGILVDGVCKAVGSGPGGGGGSEPVTKTVDCGTVSLDGSRWNSAQCGTAQHACYGPGPTRPLVPTFATLTQDPTSKTWTVQAIWCPAATTPGPDPRAIRDQALRLLPQVSIGTAPRTNTLVNIQTVLWAATTTQRTLPTVHITGQTVHLRLRLDHALWSFGDHTSDTADNPGTPYDADHNPCRTAQCPGYYGHTYTTTGTDTITLTVTWHASYSLDNTTWIDVDPAPLTGPSAATTITVREARAVLVPDPH